MEVQCSLSYFLFLYSTLSNFLQIDYFYSEMIVLWQQEYYHVPVALTFTQSFLLDACNAGDVRVRPYAVTP